MFFFTGQDYLSKLHVDTITWQGKGICRVVQKMLQESKGKKAQEISLL